jgi:hypothetical protein
MTANHPKRTFASAMTRESAVRARALLALALVLTGCNPPLVYDPQQPIAPNINDRSAPDLELRVYYDATRFDSVVKPTEAFFFSPNRCIHVSNPFRVVVAGTDLDGGISYLNIGSPDLVPTAGAIVATPLPDVPTQVDDPSSPNVTYPNPGMSPGSHTAEVSYYTGGSPPGRPFGLATLQVSFDFGGKSAADISARVKNTSVSASTSAVDGYFVRPADAAHVPGSACTPP